MANDGSDGLATAERLWLKQRQSFQQRLLRCAGQQASDCVNALLESGSCPSNAVVDILMLGLFLHAGIVSMALGGSAFEWNIDL